MAVKIGLMSEWIVWLPRVTSDSLKLGITHCFMTGYYNGDPIQVFG